jgi:hypothetical protein
VYEKVDDGGWAATLGRQELVPVQEYVMLHGEIDAVVQHPANFTHDDLCKAGEIRPDVRDADLRHIVAEDAHLEDGYGDRNGG